MVRNSISGKWAGLVLVVFIKRRIEGRSLANNRVQCVVAVGTPLDRKERMVDEVFAHFRKVQDGIDTNLRELFCGTDTGE